MNRYPAWKYAIIIFALTVGVIYTIPNFFGESPAVQVSPARATATVDTELLNRIEGGLEAANITIDAAYLDQSGVKVRFSDPDTQLRAKDILQRELGDDYVVALNLLSTHVFGSGPARGGAFSPPGRHGTGAHQVGR
jgi:preprotein translocase subunit SecD